MGKQLAVGKQMGRGVSATRQRGSTPRTIYRLQVSGDLTLATAAELVGYLHRLGVDWLYVSPILQSRSGSPHGYDTTDPGRLDEDRGGEAGLTALSAALHDRGMGLLADVVPNHLAAEPENPWWRDVLRRGPASSYAEAFDVDWHADGRIVEGDANVNYRRFFAIDSLAAVREEVPWVFDAMHTAVGRWFAASLVDGLRVDHPDGLADPEAYLSRLRAATGAGYVVVEKILATGEELPQWDCEGTTGYETLGEVDRLFVDPAGEAALNALTRAVDPEALPWDELVFACKRQVAGTILRQEARRTAREAGLENTAGDEVGLLAACLAVYRAYLPHGLELLEAAFARAKRLEPDAAPVLERLRPALTDAGHPAARRFQQFSSAVMAKGAEDRAFYRFPRLTCLTEVGADPSRFSVTPESFHEFAVSRAGRWPHAMTTLSTHDTKRSEDVRARLAVLSELPAEWASLLESVRRRARTSDGALDELLWQGIVGAWPIERERARAFALKSAREAGTRTDWVHPDEVFEREVGAVVDSVFDDPGVRDEVAAFATRLRRPGWSNSLSAKLVQLTMPGVPDVYQGTELWMYSLVDPDNRRPVDFALRSRMLGDALASPPPIDETGAAKLRLTALALRLRRDRPELFTGYRLLRASGAAAAHALAFDHGGAISIGTRLPVGLEHVGGWRDTELAVPECTLWKDVLADRVLPGGPLILSRVLADYPVALLVPVGADP